MDVNLIRIVVIETQGGSNEYDWPPEKAEEFLAWFERHLNTIPPEHRASARIEFDVRYIDEDVEPRLEISYTRPETEQEQKDRYKKARREESSLEFSERRELARLKEKYNG